MILGTGGLDGHRSCCGAARGRSTFDIDVSTDPRSGTLGFNAVMTSGTLRGARLSATPVILAQSGFCLLGGVRSLTVGFGAFTAASPAPARAVRENINRRRPRGRR